jgi:hypothetical protein
MKITGNEPAFIVDNLFLPTDYTTKGITIRQQFAMAAMQGLLSNTKLVSANDEPYNKVVAEASVKFADALINELNKSEQ